MDKPAWSDEATVEDIYYCYRLLLKREPSQEDFYSAAVLRRNQEMVTTPSTGEVIAEWEKEREQVGDVAKTYLDLVFLPNGQ